MDAGAGAGFGLGILFFVVLMVVSIGGIVLWVFALVECVRYPDPVYQAAGSEKVTWVLVVALAGWIGALIYWFAVRDRLRRAEAAGVAAYRYGGGYGGHRHQPDYAPVPPGWYKDPQADGRMRYWDGGAWTEHTA
jgi:hypothetical protein